MAENLQVLTRLEESKKWVIEAGDFLRENINQPLEIHEKSRYDDLVTNFDRAIQDLLISKILSHFPEDKVLAEEDLQLIHFDEKIPHLWILDPIDGTTNFIVQKDHFAIMLSYFEHGVGQFGLILDVMQDKLYWCDENQAFCNDELLKVPKSDFQTGLLAVNAYMYRLNVGGLLDLSKQTLGVRIYGSAGISYTELLSGKVIGYFANLQPWDYAAGKIISEKLGFVTKTISGEQPSYEGREMVFTIHQSLLEEAQKYIK